LHAHHVVFRSKGGKDTIDNLVTLCEECHKKVHENEITLKIEGRSNRLDVIAQRSMQGKGHMYKELGKTCEVGKVFGYETSSYRKEIGLEKSHIIDSLCIATLRTKERIGLSVLNNYVVSFRPRQTRRVYQVQAKKGIGRARYQVNESIGGIKKGDLVEVKGYLKVVNSIYSNGCLAFAREKGEPNSSVLSKCRVIEKCKTIQWGRM
jgi:hypothetical protein